MWLFFLTHSRFFDYRGASRSGLQKHLLDSVRWSALMHEIQSGCLGRLIPARHCSTHRSVPGKTHVPVETGRHHHSLLSQRTGQQPPHACHSDRRSSTCDHRPDHPRHARGLSANLKSTFHADLFVADFSAKISFARTLSLAVERLLHTCPKYRRINDLLCCLCNPSVLE